MKNYRITEGNAGWYVWDFETGGLLSPFYRSRAGAEAWIKMHG